MRVHSIRVKNFRSIMDAELYCSPLTALVGKNGTGKSNFLHALALFYDSRPRIEQADFYSGDDSLEIEIAVTFDSLNTEELDLFSRYVVNDILTVARVFSSNASTRSGRYHGMHLQHPEFVRVRNISGAIPLRTEYNKLCGSSRYSSLPRITSESDARREMANWEQENPEECERLRDDGQFFGFTGVAQGYLGRHTRLINVPAVRDAGEDALDQRGSAITEIMDLVVRNALASHSGLNELKEKTNAELGNIIERDVLPRLKYLAEDLTATLTSFVPDAAVALDWAPISDITIPLPQAEVRLDEDGYTSTVARSGHGLQRAFILTLLQHLAGARDSAKPNETIPEATTTSQTPDFEPPLTPTLILAIEEPELYQHPSRERHLASVLLQLAEGGIPGAASHTQVIYTTHSQLFVGLDRFDQIRVLRKEHPLDGGAKFTRANGTTRDSVTALFNEITGSVSPTSTKSFMARLQTIMTPVVNEGFFADLVVLVEGEGDRAVILGTAQAVGHSFDAQGIAVIPSQGKGNLLRLLLIFRQFGIPTYTVWDGDERNNSGMSKHDRHLLKALGKAESAWPKHIDNTSACFETNLETTMQDELGDELFEELLREAKDEFGIQRDAHKKPVVLEYIVSRSEMRGKSCASLRSIVANIVDLATKDETPLQAEKDGGPRSCLAI